MRAQAEERDKTKQQERQRKLAEELAEEQRLAKERDNMQNQFTFEQQRQKQKEVCSYYTKTFHLTALKVKNNLDKFQINEK